MKQTDFLIRVEHTQAYTKEALIQILKSSGVSGLKVTVLDSEDAGDSNDPRNYSPYIAH
tara:strand:- start:264 stop:440 length:177 start_codon:yes stop_codon:yes gene_type:complete